jgi:glutaredoxin 3
VSEEKPKHRIEIFSAGCPLCQKAINRVHQVADGSCEIEVLDMHRHRAQAQTEMYGITNVPAIVVDGKVSNLFEGEDSGESWRGVWKISKR